MEINFFQNGNYYVAEFEVKTDFNLHIERDSGRKLYIYQCTSGGGDYALVNDFCNNNNQNVIDIDFTALVYPKRIKIVSDAEPTYATVVTDGEVTEIKTQSKEIEITSNGTTVITPDLGFAYLDRVSVKINVSGGAAPKELGRNDVNFFDYDGTLLYAYTWEEAKNLTQLPPLPTHEGLEVREWNYTLEDIKAQGVNIIEVDGEHHNGNTIKEIEIEGEIYKGALYVEDSSYEGRNISIVITKGNFEKGSLCYYANNSTGKWIIDKQDDGTPYEYYVDNLFNTIGKADIGACCYDENGELVMNPDVLITPRGIEELSYLYGKAIGVLSIPNTIIYPGTPSFSDCIFTQEVKIPISLRAQNFDNYSIMNYCTAPSIYVNGVVFSPNGYYYDCQPMNRYTPQELMTEFTNIGYAEIGSYIKFLKNTTHISSIFYEPRDRRIILDFSECLSVPTLGRTTSNFYGYVFIIVPDSLFDVWKSATNWSGMADKIFPVSQYKNIILK